MVGNPVSVDDELEGELVLVGDREREFVLWWLSEERIARIGEN